MRSKILFLLCFSITVFASCKKKTGAEDSDFSVDLNHEQMHIAALTGEVAKALEEVYQSNAAVNEVNAAIFSGYYQDERVLLKDLLFPSRSDLYKTAAFTRFKVDTGVFRRRFCEIIERGKCPLISAELKLESRKRSPNSTLISDDWQLPASEVSILSGSRLVCIYFPYSKKFGISFISDSLPPDCKIAIMTRPTLASVGRGANLTSGRDPGWCPGSPGNVCYRDVVVDNRYAETIRTHIVGIGGSVHVNAASDEIRNGSLQ